MLEVLSGDHAVESHSWRTALGQSPNPSGPQPSPWEWTEQPTFSDGLLIPGHCPQPSAHTTSFSPQEMVSWWRNESCRWSTVLSFWAGAGERAACRPSGAGWSGRSVSRVVLKIRVSHRTFWISDIFFLTVSIFIYPAVLGLSCCMQDLQLLHVGSSSLTRDQTWVPCIGSMQSLPLDHKGSPSAICLSLKSWQQWVHPCPSGNVVTMPWCVCVSVSEGRLWFTSPTHPTLLQPLGHPIYPLF